MVFAGKYNFVSSITALHMLYGENTVHQIAPLVHSSWDKNDSEPVNQLKSIISSMTSWQLLSEAALSHKTSSDTTQKNDLRSNDKIKASSNYHLY